MPEYAYSYNTVTDEISWRSVVGPRHGAPDEWHRRQTLWAPESISSPKHAKAGARSLVDMSVRVMATNFSSLGMDDLKLVPRHLIYLVWQYMENTQESLEFQSWKICARYLWDGEPIEQPLTLSVLKHAEEISSPTGLLVQYITPLISTSFDFIAHLVITDSAAFNTHELLSLSQLKNLGVLEIIQPGDEVLAATFPRVTDSIVREWAREPDPFPVLRVLRIWGNDFTTTKSLRYLASFPALTLYDTAGKLRDWDSADTDRASSGWSYQRKTWSDNLVMTLAAHFTLLGHWDILIRKLDGFSLDYMVAALLSAARSRSHILALRARTSPQPSSRQQPLAYTEHVKFIDGLCFDLWGFLLYASIGEASSDREFLARGLSLPDQASVGEALLLPPRPFASLSLGRGSHLHPETREYDMCKQKKRRILQGLQQRATFSRYCDERRIEAAFEAYTTFVRLDSYSDTPSEEAGPKAAKVGKGTKRRRPVTEFLPTGR
ncbi:Uu.00g135830.m01.CDS01 [Anthostomella pinea]|uniref:Uu.00g135830.m01.CDS01 n=1 Tax=Anthostomella pinea TaxID=933095 RepID=A0AAI8VP72_9PEZI|nr:Uu.00g135830.m01.CDS01 [Anthostomella pinea]